MSVESINYNARALSRKSPMSMACRTGDLMYGGSFKQRVPYPVDNVNVNSVPSVSGYYPSQDIYIPAESGESIVGSSLSGAALMAPIMARHAIAHPVQGFKAIKEASGIFSDLAKSGALKNLSAAQQADIFKTLYKNAQLGPKVVHKSVSKALAKAKNAYLNAIRSGNTVQAAEKAAEMTSLIDNGRKSIIPFTKVKQAKVVTETAKQAGAAAGKAATASAAEATAAAARVAEATTKTGKAIAYGKNALAWTKSSLKVGGAGPIAVIEGLLETPEVVGAFANGGFGEGVKQTTKSAVKVGASTLGWCVGAKGGTALGAAIGSAVCPGIGTAIGSALGFIVGGIAGSMGATKVAKAVTGKSYSEKQQETAYAPAFNPMLAPSIYDMPQRIDYKA